MFLFLFTSRINIYTIATRQRYLLFWKLYPMSPARRVLFDYFYPPYTPCLVEVAYFVIAVRSNEKDGDAKREIQAQLLTIIHGQ